MKRVSLSLVLLVLLCGTANPIALPIQIFDSFGDICCDEEKARLDNFAVNLQQQPDTTGYIIFYGGKLHNYPYCHSARRRLPRRGESRARAARMKPYLVDTRGLDASRVVVVDGGYRESWTAELWIVPRGANPPTPSPTITRQEIHFRKGQIKKRDYECEV